MKSLLAMTIAQFKILMRNRTLLVASLGIAIISMFIFGFLFGDNGTDALDIGVVDLDKTQTSAQVIDSMKKTADITVHTGTEQKLLDELKQGRLSALVILQVGFEQGLRQGNAQARFYVDQTDVMSAARSEGSIRGIFDGVSKEVAGYKDLVQLEERQVTVRQQRTIDVLTPGMLGLTILYANIYTGMILTSWRQSGILKRLSATPLKAWQLITAQIAGQFLLSLAQAAAVLLIAVYVFQVQVTVTMLPSIAVFVLAGSFSIIALGYAVGNFVPKPDAAQSVATLIALPMMFLGGSYFPVNVEGPLQFIVEIAPLTHMNRAFQQIMLNEASLPALLPQLGILLLIGILLLALSIRTFRWSW